MTTTTIYKNICVFARPTLEIAAGLATEIGGKVTLVEVRNVAGGPNRAANIAKAAVGWILLVDGKGCPCCGSTNHPKTADAEKPSGEG
jgi:hypothetical protein